MVKELFEALKETCIMVSLSTIFSLILGFIPALILVLTDDNGLKPNKIVYKSLDVVINILRSFPFIILMVVVIPLTRVLTGTSIGTAAAIVPLTIAATPFVARVIESALKEVDKGVIEAAKAFGLKNSQILFKVMIKEAMPSIAQGLTLTVISIVGYSAMAGVIGGGGLGDTAIRFGYQRFQTDVMIYTVVILIVLVQLLQGIGDLIYKKLIK